ncbi:MAG: zinc ribbon domain-containing protein [Candidatus Methanofastidiosia archaeon]
MSTKQDDMDKQTIEQKSSTRLQTLAFSKNPKKSGGGTIKDRISLLKEALERTAAIFFILWIVAAFTNFLGKFEYESQFLQFGIVIFLLSRLSLAFRQGYSPGERLRTFFSNLGWTTLGLWIVLGLLYWATYAYVGFGIDILFSIGIVSLIGGGTVYAVYELAFDPTPSGDQVRKFFSHVGLIFLGLWVALKGLYSLEILFVDVKIDSLLVTGIISLIGSGILYALCEMKRTARASGSTGMSESTSGHKSTCRHCGEVIDEAWVSCPYCGTDLRSDTRIYDDETSVF